VVISQELVNWGAKGLYGASLLTDCFSLFTHKGSRWERERKVFHNDHYGSIEATHMRQLGELYNAATFPSKNA
jgi:hypothetical protein